MVVRLGAGAALVAVALLGFTVAVPQDASLGLDTSLKDFVKPRGGENVAGLDQVEFDDEDLGDLLDRLDGAGLDPDLARNIDPVALAALLDGLSPQELAALGLSAQEAADLAARLRDPNLTDEELAAIAAGLADRGLGFVNADADGRFDGGEIAYADLDGDGTVSEGDLRLGVLALLLGFDRGLSEAARDLLQAYERAGAVGLGRPATAASKATATAGTAPLAAAGFPTDRAIGPPSVVCVPLYSPSLTCHTRTFVQGAIIPRGDYTLFALDATRTPLTADPFASGPRASGRVVLDLTDGSWTPVPSLTPDDHLVAVDDTSVDLARDDNGMVWAMGRSGRTHLNLTWAVDLAYYDFPVAADVTPQHVPEADRPKLDALALATGLHIAELAGAHDRPYGDTVRALAAFVRGFGVGPLPDRDAQADDLLAVAEARVGCARHRAEVFVLAAQALGIPARLVVNEAHAFAEAFVPKAGWHLVDVGACGQIQVQQRPGHEEVMAHQDLPYVSGDAPASQADSDQVPAVTRIDITEVPTTLRRNTDFTIAGQASSDDGTLPAGIPITFTYNRTKETPGTPFCSTQTLEGGDYRATCRLGQGTPAGSLQLVARLAPSVVAGVPSTISYSDPPFTVQKATNLTLLGPPVTSATVPVAYTAHVLDEDGEPVPARPVTLRVDGAGNLTRFTDATGRARFTLQLEPGAHTLTARLAGDDTYDPSQGSLAIEASEVFIALQVDADALESGTLVAKGAYATADGPKAGQRLTVRWRNDPDGSEQLRSVTSGPGGALTIAFEGAPRPGPGLFSVYDPGTGVGVDVAFARNVDAHAVIQLPERWTLGAAVPTTVRVTGPEAAVPIQLLVDGLSVADLAAGETQPGEALLTIAEGRHIVTVRAGEGVRLTAASAAITMSPVNATVDVPLVHGPGATVHVAGQLTFGGRGLDGLVHVRGAGATATGASGRDGSFALDLTLPKDAPAGPATLLLEAPQVGFQQAIPIRIQRAANLAIDAPSLSLQAFGATPVVVRGEGNVTVQVDGRPLGEGGRLEVPSNTWLVRRLQLSATAIPGSPDLAPATATATITVVNPLALLAIPLIVTLVGVAGVKGLGAIRRRHAHRNRFLPKAPRSPVRILQPSLPRRVPRVFDPAQDEALVVRLPRAGPWQVRDGRGRPVRCQVEGRVVRVPLREVPAGRQRLWFTDGRRALAFDCAVGDLRSALDEETLAILGRVGQVEPWPATLQSFESGLGAAGAHPDDARTIRRLAEEALYKDDEGLQRPRFHAFFAAVDQAQARRPT